MGFRAELMFSGRHKTLSLSVIELRFFCQAVRSVVTVLAQLYRLQIETRAHFMVGKFFGVHHSLVYPK